MILFELIFHHHLVKKCEGGTPLLLFLLTSYNRETNYILVCPITSHGNNFRFSSYLLSLIVMCGHVL